MASSTPSPDAVPLGGPARSGEGGIVCGPAEPGAKGRVRCPGCRTILDVTGLDLGLEVSCQACGDALTIPDAAGEVDPVEEEPADPGTALDLVDAVLCEGCRAQWTADQLDMTGHGPVDCPRCGRPIDLPRGFGRSAEGGSRSPDRPAEEERERRAAPSRSPGGEGDLDLVEAVFCEGCGARWHEADLSDGPPDDRGRHPCPRCGRPLPDPPWETEGGRPVSPGDPGSSRRASPPREGTGEPSGEARAPDRRSVGKAPSAREVLEGLEKDRLRRVETHLQVGSKDGAILELIQPCRGDTRLARRVVEHLARRLPSVGEEEADPEEGSPEAGETEGDRDPSGPAPVEEPAAGEAPASLADLEDRVDAAIDAGDAERVAKVVREAAETEGEPFERTREALGRVREGELEAPRLLRLEGELLASAGFVYRAVRAIQRGLDLDPADEEETACRRALARLLRELGLDRGLLEQVEALREAGEATAEDRLHEAVALARLGRPEEALACVEAGDEANEEPDAFEDLWAELAGALAAVGRAGEACELLSDRIEAGGRGGGPVDPVLRKTLVLAEAHRTADRKRSLAGDLAGGDVEAGVDLVRLLLDEGQREAAVETLATVEETAEEVPPDLVEVAGALAADPPESGSSRRLAGILLDLGEAEEAVAIYESMREAGSPDPWIDLDLVEAYLASGRAGEAEEVVAGLDLPAVAKMAPGRLADLTLRLVLARPASKEALLLRGRSLRALDDVSGATWAFRAGILAGRPGPEEALELGALLLLSGRTEEALRAYVLAGEVGAGAVAWMEAARLALAEEDLPLAQDLVGRVLSEDPGHEEARALAREVKTAVQDESIEELAAELEAEAPVDPGDDRLGRLVLLSLSRGRSPGETREDLREAGLDETEEARFYLGKARSWHLDRGNPVDAARTTEELIRARGEDLDADEAVALRYEVARELEEADRPGEARRTYLRILEVRPDHADVVERLEALDEELA